MTHPRTARCPRVAEDWQWEVERGTCCTADIGEVIEILERFDEAKIAAKLRECATAEQAVKLGDELECVDEGLLGTCEADPDTDEALNHVGDCDILLAIGDWYRKLGEQGFGVSFIRVTSLTDAPQSEAHAA